MKEKNKIKSHYSQIESLFKIDDVIEFVDTLYALINCKSHEDYITLPIILRIIVSVYRFDLELNNGGVHQFLSNSSGDLSKDIIRYLSEIGADKSYEIMNQISSYFPNNDIPQDRVSRNEAIEKIEDSYTYSIFDKENRVMVKEDRLSLLYTFLNNHKLELVRAIEERISQCNQCIEGIDEEIISGYENAEIELAKLLKSDKELHINSLINEIKNCLRKRDRNSAIKLYYKEYGCSLNEAKKAINDLEKKLNL